jgi:hypothetical protein
VRPVAIAVVCKGVVFQEYMYGAVPPDTTAVDVALFPPTQNRLLIAALAVSKGGWLRVRLTVEGHPLASVIVRT